MNIFTIDEKGDTLPLVSNELWAKGAFSSSPSKEDTQRTFPLVQTLPITASDKTIRSFHHYLVRRGYLRVIMIPILKWRFPISPTGSLP